MTTLTRLCEKLGIRAVVAHDPHPKIDAAKWPAGSLHYRVTLVRTVEGQRRTLTTEFHQGPLCSREPTPADVLSSLLLDARAADSTFEEWCGEFGFDPDSRKAEHAWQQCRKIAPRVARFCGRDREALEGAEH